MKSHNKINSNYLSRRSFLQKTNLATVGLATLSPSIAQASIEGETTTPEGTNTKLWADAVAEAKQNGYPIFYNCEDDIYHFIPANKKVSYKLEGDTSISGRPEHISAVAYYTVTDDRKRIVRMTDLVIYATASEVKSKKYDYILADGGRTLIVNCDLVLRSNYLGISQRFSLHMEYPRTNSGGFMRIEYA